MFVKSFKAIFSGIAWIICLGLRYTAWSANRLQRWIGSGPSPRLWAASDDDLIRELRKRGVRLESKRSNSKNGQGKTPARTITKTVTVNVSDYSDIELAVANLQDVSRQRAREAVQKAVREIEMSGDRPSDNVILSKAVKYT